MSYGLKSGWGGPTGGYMGVSPNYGYLFLGGPHNKD